MRKSLYFEKQKKTTQRADNINSVSVAKRYPCMKLVFNYDWDDYGESTWFSLWFLQDSNKLHYYYIGDVKIMHRDGNVYDKLPESFEELDENFCSVGIDISYYKKLQSTFKRNAVQKILKALRDCAIDMSIYEQYRTHTVFKESLTRDLSTERAIKEAPFVIDGRKHEDAYSFEFTYCPIYNEDAYIKWNVEIDYEPAKYKRTYGLIGENGVGKTQMLSNCVKALINRGIEILNNQPMFSSIFVICSSIHDAYNNIDKNGILIPLYICITEQSQVLEENLTIEIKEILKRPTFYHDGGLESMREVYLNLLEAELGEAAVENLIVGGIIENHGIEHTEYETNTQKLNELVKTLSSGQLQMLVLITYVCAHIHLATLIIVDEPEVHLHPKFITDFICKLNVLLNLFESYAIISTHSPIVIREIVGENVFLMQRNADNQPLIGKVAYETFGENISTLYNNIFGCDERKCYYAKVVRELVEKRGATYESVTKELKDSGVKNANE